MDISNILSTLNQPILSYYQWVTHVLAAAAQWARKRVDLRSTPTTECNHYPLFPLDGISQLLYMIDK